MDTSPSFAPVPNRAARRAAIRRKAGAAMSASALAASGAALAVHAAAPASADTTFTVTSLDDDGSPGTLRWAIEQANVTIGADTIDFEAAVVGTIELTDHLPTITEDLAIVGPGADVVTISGMDEWALIGFTNAGTSSISGLTLTRGNVTNGDSPHNDDYSGGGLSVYGTDVTASAMVITANYAYNDGGGAWCNSLYDGKAEDDIPASLTITGSVVSDNDAFRGGGGMYTSDCDLTVVDSVVSGNEAHDGDGGGIYFYDGSDADADVLLVRNTTVSGNTSDEDGGGLQVDGSQAATHRIENTTVAGNTAAEYGGGIYANLQNEATLVVSNSTISGNSTEGRGGALFVGAGDVTLVQTTVTLNSASASVAEVNASVITGETSAIVVAGYYPTEEMSVRADGSDADQDRPGAPTPLGVDPPRPASLTLVGSIVAANAGGDLGTGIAAVSTITGSSSVIGTIDPGANVVDAGGNQTGVADPGLGPLQDNGGPTDTHALLTGSPAIDTGAVPPPSFPLDTDDQRGPGYARVSNGRIDVGAFEVQVTAIEPNFTG